MICRGEYRPRTFFCPQVEWSTEIYDDIWEYIVEVLPEQGMGDIKNWMRKQVTILRKKPSKNIDEFSKDLEAFIDTKGLRTS